jgi:hypothetical protein
VHRFFVAFVFFATFRPGSRRGLAEKLNGSHARGSERRFHDRAMRAVRHEVHVISSTCERCREDREWFAIAPSADCEVHDARARAHVNETRALVLRRGYTSYSIMDIHFSPPRARALALITSAGACSVRGCRRPALE